MQPSDYGAMIAARVNPAVREKLDRLAAHTGRRKNHLLTEAIDLIYERHGPGAKPKGDTDT
jgi:predicted DNA-binding protein